MDLVLDEQTRCEVLHAQYYEFFPPPFIALVASYLKTKIHYTIFMDLAELPLWRVRRADRCFIYDLEFPINYDVTITLRDTGTISADFYSIELAKKI